MTEGQHDGEVLVAIRKANAMLAEDNLNWEELFIQIVAEAGRQGPAPKADQQKPAGKIYDDQDEINTYFKNIYKGGLKGGFKTFIESVNEWWDEKGYLTEKQYQAVKKAGTRGAWTDVS
jgi:hypothetical protein